jgi:hypothetical protein
VIFALSAVAVTATSMLASLWVIFSFLAAWCLRGVNFPLVFLRRAPAAFTGMVIGGACLAAYYSWSLRSGLQIPRFGQQIVVSFFHGAYEMLGFTGLGPARLTLRESGMRALFPYAVPIGLLGLCWALIVALPLKLGRGRRFFAGRRGHALVLLLLPAISVFVIGHFQGVRVSPRYLIPFVPMMIALAAGSLTLVWRLPSARVFVILFFALTLFSALQIRFAPRHAKEDYRRAAAFAKAQIEQGRTICWAADIQTGIYYELINESERDTGSRQIFLAQAPGEKPVPEECTVVVLSRLDVYDTMGRIRRFIQDNEMREAAVLIGFWIYVAAPEATKTAS